VCNDDGDGGSESKFNRTQNWYRESGSLEQEYDREKLIKMSISHLDLLDGMTDCSDSECCLHPVCSEHIMCLSSNDPVDVLLRKQPPSVTASFYQRVKFLIEENSVQSYAHKDDYSER
jgi:hypothetical protein